LPRIALENRRAWGRVPVASSAAGQAMLFVSRALLEFYEYGMME